MLGLLLFAVLCSLACAQNAELYLCDSGTCTGCDTAELSFKVYENGTSTFACYDLTGSVSQTEISIVFSFVFFFVFFFLFFFFFLFLFFFFLLLLRCGVIGEVLPRRDDESRLSRLLHAR
jgi:hypothetical protein